jgi:hypothetical protein
MTESTETTTTVDNVAAEPEPSTVPDENPEASPDETNPGAQEDHPARDAAKYRKRAQAAEKERDRLAERLQVLQRTEVQRLAAEHLADGADLWRDGATLDDVLNDDGDVDADKVTELAKGLLEQHRHWRKLAHAAPPASTVTSNGKITGDRPGNTFEDAFRPRSG